MAIQARAADSLGIEIIQGQALVLHQVEPQETLYRLSKRYGVTVKAIKDQNNIKGNALSLGSILRIPWRKTLVHQVQAGETLYTLSKTYGVSIEELRQWNDLEGHALVTNSVLQIGTGSHQAKVANDRASIQGDRHLVQSKETLYSIAKQYGISIKNLQAWNNLEDFSLNTGDTIWISSPDSRSAQPSEPLEEQLTVPEPDTGTVTSTEASIYEELPPEEPIRSKVPLKPVRETGLAAVFENSDTKKYLALHRSAPVGTIMQVRNEMTNLTVFVRVVGKLPDTGANDKVLLRLSKAAQSGLGALDSRFRVEVSYIPNQ